MEIPVKSFTRSIAALSFSLLFLLAAFARPALAQSDDDAQMEFHASANSKLNFGLDFGDVVVGTTSPPQTVTVINRSSKKAIKVRDIIVRPPFVESASTCGSSIPAGG